MTPVHDAVSALVTAMKSENVNSVMCAGRWLLDDGEITVLDEGGNARRGPGAGGSRRTPRRSALVAVFFGL